MKTVCWWDNFFLFCDNDSFSFSSLSRSSTIKISIVEMILKGPQKTFSNFFRIMHPLYKHSSGSQGSIAPNRFSKLYREHAFLSLFRFWYILYGPYSPIEAKIEISSKKRVPGRILKNGLLQSIPEILNASGRIIWKKAKTFFTVKINIWYYKFCTVQLQ